MKRILTHTARNTIDVIQLLREGGSFSCPNLPHYRYRPTQQARHELGKRGFLQPTGKTNVGTNYKASGKFKEWQNEYDTGLTKLMPVKWDKERKRAKNE